MWIWGCFLSVALVTVTVLLGNLFLKAPIRTSLVWTVHLGVELLGQKVPFLGCQLYV